jgi:hypothetical protein
MVTSAISHLGLRRVDFLTMEDEEAGQADGKKQPAAAGGAATANKASGPTATPVAVTAATPAAAARADGDLPEITANASSCGRQLMRACADVFRFGGAYTGSWYVRQFAMEEMPYERVSADGLAAAVPAASVSSSVFGPPSRAPGARVSAYTVYPTSVATGTPAPCCWCRNCARSWRGWRRRRPT